MTAFGSPCSINSTARRRLNSAAVSVEGMIVNAPVTIEAEIVFFIPSASGNCADGRSPRCQRYGRAHQPCGPVLTDLCCKPFTDQLSIFFGRTGCARPIDSSDPQGPHREVPHRF